MAGRRVLDNGRMTGNPSPVARHGLPVAAGDVAVGRPRPATSSLRHPCLITRSPPPPLKRYLAPSSSRAFLEQHGGGRHHPRILLNGWASARSRYDRGPRRSIRGEGRPHRHPGHGHCRAQRGHLSGGVRRRQRSAGAAERSDTPVPHQGGPRRPSESGRVPVRPNPRVHHLPRTVKTRRPSVTVELPHHPSVTLLQRPSRLPVLQRGCPPCCSSLHGRRTRTSARRSAASESTPSTRSSMSADRSP